MAKKAVKIDYSKLREKAKRIAENTPRTSVRRPTEQQVVGRPQRQN